MAKAEILDNISRLISDANKILVCGHDDPDGDSVGTMLAMRRYLLTLDKDVTVIRKGIIPYKYMFLPDIDRIIELQNAEGHHDLVIFLECSNPARAGNVSALYGDKTKIINIDHHPDNTGYGEAVWQDVEASSVGEMIWEFLDHVGYAFDEPCAMQLYTAILTDTGRFRFNSTTRKTMEAAGRMIEYGASPRNICDRVYFSLKPSTLKLTGMLLTDMEYHADDRICFMFLTEDKIKNSAAAWDEVEGLVDYANIPNHQYCI